jgi:hypothetical protein
MICWRNNLAAHLACAVEKSPEAFEVAGLFPFSSLRCGIGFRPSPERRAGGEGESTLSLNTVIPAHAGIQFPKQHRKA